MKTHTLGPLHWEHWPSVVLLFCNKINLYMSRVLPAQSKVLWLLRNFVKSQVGIHATQQPYLLRDRFEHGWNNAQHHLSSRFVAMLKIKLHVFFCAFYLSFTQCKMHHLNEMSHAYNWPQRQGKNWKYHQLSIANLVTHQSPFGFRNLSDYYLPCHSIQEQQLKTAI